MTYTAKIRFPKEEAVGDSKLTTTTKNELVQDLHLDEICALVEQLESTYTANFAFKDTDDIEDGERDPFETAHKLEEQGIEYKATIAIKDKGNYGAMVDAMHALESQDYGFKVGVSLNINEDSAVDCDEMATWTDMEDAIYTVTPKVNVDDIRQIKTLYDILSEKYDVEIKIKPKKKKDEVTFRDMLQSYPDGTEVTISLSEPKY
jgi:hypothetical protein